MDVPIITITGTKGKTTTAYVVDQVMQTLGRDVLRVDTTGHYVNGAQRSTLSDSKKLWGLVPTIAPGRYLWEFYADPTLQDKGLAVLEASLGCSSISGMGYRVHKVGVFLNVYEDHLGSSTRLQTRRDIAKAKEFVYERLSLDGWAVCNADDELVVESLKAVSDHLGATVLPCGIDFLHFDLDAHLSSGGHALTVRNKQIILLGKEDEQVLVDLTQIPWTFEGDFMPSVWNVLMAVGAVYAELDGAWTDACRTAFEAVRLDRSSGRLTLMRAKNGATVLVDYAHEKNSLLQVGMLARKLAGDDGKTIAVVRLATDRTDELITETGKAIAPAYDNFVVYDKVDGHWRHPKRLRSKRFKEVVGHVSEVFATSIAVSNSNVDRILREDLALQRAVELAEPKDVIVYIVNDDIKRSLGFAQDLAGATFL